MTLDPRLLLSPRRAEVLAYICAHTTSHGYPPSIRELADHCGFYSTSSVLYHLRGLEEAGLIWRDPGKTRAIVVVQP